MLRSHHLYLYGNTQRKNYEVRSYEVSGKVCAGGVDFLTSLHFTLILRLCYTHNRDASTQVHSASFTPQNKQITIK